MANPGDIFKREGYHTEILCRVRDAVEFAGVRGLLVETVITDAVSTKARIDVVAENAFEDPVMAWASSGLREWARAVAQVEAR